MKSRSSRLPTISDTPDDWVDESWTVDCVCGVNFDDGEEMVDCDECGVWVHTRCSRYVKSEKLFACDKCKNKKLRKESEETEVAQLLVELPTKTLRMDMSCPPQTSYQVWTEIPLEEKVHVQGIPGGDPALFGGVSSVFSPELWKCTGYVPKRFNFQYREFPCWDDANKGKEEIEIHASKGADALFSLSKENAMPGMKPHVNGGCASEMGPPTTDPKKQELDTYEGRRPHSSVRKEGSNQKKDDSRVFKDLNRKKNAKSMDKEGLSKKRDLHSFESVSTTSSDAKQSESNEGKGPRVFKIDKQSCKHENLRADVQANHKPDGCLDMINTANNPCGQPVENVSFDASREAKQMAENDANQVPPSVKISPQTENGMSSSLIHNPTETISMKDEVVHDVDDANDNGRSSINNLEKLESAPLQQIEAKPVEVNHCGKTSVDLMLDSSKTLPQDAKISDAAVSVSQVQKVPNIDKSTSLDESAACQPKPRTGSAVGKPSISSPAVGISKPSVLDRNSSARQKSKKDNGGGDACKKPAKKLLKELAKALSKSALKSSHLSKSSSHAPVSKDPAILPSSKTSSVQVTDSGDSANSLNASELSLRGGEKMSHHLNRQPAPPKNHHPPHVHPPPNAPATLSDEELALLLHHELNSSPRVPRVPRMRHAGSLPQLASNTSTTTLMKRTSSSGVNKDNGLVVVSRKKSKDSTSNSREPDGARKVRRHEHMVKKVSTTATASSGGPSSSNEHNISSSQNASDDDNETPTHRTLPGLIAEIMSKGKRMTYEELCNAVLPHWPNLRKHNGERYAYSSHSQAVLDCLRNRSEWSRLVDRGPKTNAGRKRRRGEGGDAQNVEESEEDDFNNNNNNINSLEEEEEEKQKTGKKQRRLAQHGRGISRRRRRKAEVVIDDVDSSSSSSSSSSSESSSDSSEESAFSSDQEMIGGGAKEEEEASASSDEMGTMSS